MCGMLSIPAISHSPSARLALSQGRVSTVRLIHSSHTLESTVNNPYRDGKMTLPAVITAVMKLTISTLTSFTETINVLPAEIITGLQVLTSPVRLA